MAHDFATMTDARTTPKPHRKLKLQRETIEKFAATIFDCNPSFRGLAPAYFDLTVRITPTGEPNRYFLIRRAWEL